ncbi:hypothetical protein BCR43DRAFT_565205 [Syncephalastrum racemosum]|uniref:BZIP domain-containing protein n=1 Tax=Syncephalastrum racemosum TaxID=13706 RepID=A0A1X2H8X2_SYNRA|nr:hypothetical protein BCR43DRAFT_565205 [Syncephalastrum racemosum]
MNTTTDYANSNPPVLLKASEPVALAPATGNSSSRSAALAEDPSIIAQPILLTAASGVFPPRRPTTSTCSSPPLEPAPEGQSPGSSSSSDSCGSPTSLYLHIPCEDTNEKASWFNGPLSPPPSSGGSLLLGHRDSRAFMNTDEHYQASPSQTRLEQAPASVADSDDMSIASSRASRKRASDAALSDNDDDEDPKVKRKAQNRAAQRAFRERKERYVKELENKIRQVQENHQFATAQLMQENLHLRSIVYRLEAENFALKGIHVQFPIHPLHSSSTSSSPPPPPPASSFLSSMPQPPPVTPTPAPSSPMHKYTFSISTPATLHERQQRKRQRSHPNSNQEQSQHHDQDNLQHQTQQQQQKIQQQQAQEQARQHHSSEQEKHQEQQFSQRLTQLVSDHLLEQLLNEPLFDKSGNLLTEPAMQQDEQWLTCPEIFKRLKQHARCSNLTLDQLCDLVKSECYSTEEHGPVLSASSLNSILYKLEAQ